MEIVTLVLSGALEHADSTGTGSVIRPGDVQRMSAGTGILHSVFNHSRTDPVHLLQIWLLPTQRGLEPGYEERSFDEDAFADSQRLVAAPDGREDALTIHSAAELSMGRLEAGREIERRLRPNRHAYVQVATGRAAVTDDAGTTYALGAGSAAKLSSESAVRLRALELSQVLVFDLD